MIELMIAIALISFTGLIIGTLKGHIAVWHQEASLYLKAATLASSLMDSDEKKVSHDASITIRKEVSQPFKEIPYASITVTLEMPFQGKRKTFTFVGGKAFYDAHP